MKRAKRRSSLTTPQRWLLAIFLILLAAVLGILAFRAVFQKPEQKTELPTQPTVSVQTPEQKPDAPKDDPETPPEELTSHYERKEDFFTILVAGVDDGNGGSDTNILLGVDAVKGEIYGVSIPRDTKSVINGRNYKINAAYNIGGIDKMAEVISTQLGIPVDYTVVVDLRGFKALVNAIGGIDFYVPLNMDYDDPVQNLAIHVTKGQKHLDGETALKVVRFRHNNDGTGYGSEDIGRMQTQQNFLKAVAKQTLTLNNLTKIDDFVKIFQQHVETDLTLNNLAWLGKEAITMGSDAISFSTLPNDWKSPYIYLIPDEVLTLVNEHLNPYTEDRTMEDLNIPR